jgi:ribose transport system ATP-binding protein
LPAAAESIKEVLGFAGAHRAPAEGGREEQGPDAYWRRHFEIVYGLHAMRDVQPSTGSGLAAPKLELRGVSKAFPGVRALTDVSLSIWPGETHMVLGENGAGKSTLMKVLCGAVSADSGEILYDGSPRRIASPADARELGIAVIFQEFSLVPHLDVAQNVFLGREPQGWIPGTTNRTRLYTETRRVLETIGFDIDPRKSVHRLGVAHQQMVEIAKALSQDARVLVMDEPTAALSDRESERLFAMIAKLKADGVGIVYISHRMAEVFALGDRITVLRDGKRVRTLLRGEATPDELVRLMVGRSVDTTYPRQFRKPGATMLEVRGLSSTSGINGVDLTVREGEIVGLCGLVGSGRTEVARAVFGADKVTSGEVRVFGRIASGSPEVSTRLGMALIPESRKSEGLALIRTVGDNILLAGLPRLFRSGLLRVSVGRAAAQKIVARLRIVNASLQQQVLALSGGNQQKIVIGKWLVANSRLFIFDEPTRGIDIGAKAQIFALIDALVAAGAGVLMISSEQSEIVHVCDRAYVMRNKRIVGELGRAELSEENIVRLGMQQ